MARGSPVSRWHQSLWLAVILLLPPALPAQSPAAIAGLDAFLDSLTAGQVSATTSSAGDPASTIRSALLVLATDSSAGRDPFDAALLRLTRVLDRQPDWPYAWYGLGRIELTMWDRHFVAKPTAYHAAGVTYRRGAMEAYARALQADPGFVPAAVGLADLVIELGHRKLESDFLAPLLRATTPATPPVVHLAVARLASSGRDYPTALGALGRYAAAGGDRGIFAVECARVLQALGRTDEAATVYLTGLSAITASGRAAYGEDIGWIASPGELADFDTLATGQVADWLQHFWRQRDALELRAVGERLREHLRRWVYAHQNFLIQRPDDVPIHSEGQRFEDQEGMFDENDPYLAMVIVNVAPNTPGWRLYARNQWEVDDRGAIYIRHGEPSRKASAPRAPPNESWLYVRTTGRPIFHFLGSHALGTAAATTLVASLPLIPDMLDARGGLDPRYSAIGLELEGRALAMRAWTRRNGTPSLREAVSEIRYGRRHSARTIALAGIATSGLLTGGQTPGSISVPAERVYGETTLGRTAVTDAMATDNFARSFDHSLDAVMQLYGVGQDSGEAKRVLAVFAVAGSQITPSRRPDGQPGLLYPVTIRLVALDRASGAVRQLDTTRTFLTQDTLRTGQHLTGLIEMPVPPGVYQVRALTTVPGLDAGAAVGRDEIDLSATPRQLVLSDLILGREGQLTWPYRGQRIPLNPLDAFPRGIDASLFHEIAGLNPGASYTVSIAVQKAGDKPGSQPLLAITFELVADSSYQVVQRSIGLSQLKPGAYVLEVGVRELGSNRVVSRSRGLNILK